MQLNNTGLERKKVLHPYESVYTDHDQTYTHSRLTNFAQFKIRSRRKVWILSEVVLKNIKLHKNFDESYTKSPKNEQFAHRNSRSDKRKKKGCRGEMSVGYNTLTPTHPRFMTLMIDFH